jgi:GIY-YIG catalytic domain-containing protein
VQKSDILDFGRFSGWFDVAGFVDAKGAGRAEWARVAPPRCPGVYVFATSSIPQTHADSDIFYIGKADSLRDRIGKYLYRVRRSGEPEQYGGYVGSPRSAEQGITSLVEQGLSVEIGWLVTETKEAASEMEAKLLATYRSEHGQLPPNNRIGGARL